MADQILLTPDEAAELLRITPQDVIAMIEDGTLGGLQIRSHWRVTSKSITQFLSENLRAQNLKALNRRLHDHSVWANLLAESPELRRKVENEHFEPGSMGGFLQEALAVATGTKSRNVVQFKNSTDETKDS
jgi:excisionase family DNA binding protein